MIRYSIYTENKNKEKLIKYLNTCFNGFTVIETIGYWKGKEEKGLKIEIISQDYNCNFIKSICEYIKIINNQEAIYLTTEKIEAELL